MAMVALSFRTSYGSTIRSLLAFYVQPLLFLFQKIALFRSGNNIIDAVLSIPGICFYCC